MTLDQEAPHHSLGGSAQLILVSQQAEEADAITLDGGAIYEAGKEHGLKPVVGEVYDQGEGGDASVTPSPESILILTQHILTYILTHKHIYAQLYSHTPIHTLIHIFSTPTYKHTYMYFHTHVHSHIYMHSLTHMLTYKYSCAPTYSYTYTHMHAHLHAAFLEGTPSLSSTSPLFLLEVGTSYYAVAVVRRGSNMTIGTLKGVKSCHTGLNRTVGWNVPVGYLVESGRLSVMGCDVLRGETVARAPPALPIPPRTFLGAFLGTSCPHYWPAWYTST